MTQLILDETLLQKLPMLTQPVELCNPDGTVLGQFVPRLDPLKYDLEPKVSDEELDRREQCLEPSYSTAEVLARLEKL
jgi:hypothetical protein